MKKTHILLALAIIFTETAAAQDDKIKLRRTDSTATEENKESETSTTTTTAEGGELKTTTERRRIRTSRIQEVEQYHKEKEGKNIFGLGLIGFHGGMNFNTVKGATNAGAPSDKYNGMGAGILFDMQLAGGQANSIGIRTSGAWYWRWGGRAHLDFFRGNATGDSKKREVNEIYGSVVVKYYFPFDEYAFSSKIIILNRFQAFLGIGPMWSVGINDTVESTTDRTFKKGPTQSDMFFAVETGFNARLTTLTWFTFDFRFGLNLSSDIRDDITGKIVTGTGGGGNAMALHAGFAYGF